jgi:hypothetical protein
MIYDIVYASLISVILVLFTYNHCGWKEIKECYSMWLSKKYWTNYNVVEAFSWFAKAVVIVPGLIFGLQVWQLYWVTLITSIALIWASNKKLLPTLVGFNTLWIWISCVVLFQNF